MNATEAKKRAVECHQSPKPASLLPFLEKAHAKIWEAASRGELDTRIVVGPEDNDLYGHGPTLVDFAHRYKLMAQLQHEGYAITTKQHNYFIVSWANAL